MKTISIRLAVAVITFTVGLALFSLTEFWLSRVSRLSPTLKVTNEIPVEPVPQRDESPPLPPDGKIPKGTDLSIAVELPENPPSFDVRHLKLTKHRRTSMALDLGEHVDGHEVTVHLDSRSSYRILQRYRTSMTISAEGPHLDLLDWRHFDSPWIPLEQLGANRFRTLRSEQMDSSRFPKTTKAEIRKEAQRRVGKEWPELLDLVETCDDPDYSACIVTISSIYLRVQKQVKDRWLDVGLVEIAIPMGC